MRQAATAIEHFHDPREHPRRQSQCARILAFLEQSGRARTLKEIAFALGIPDSTVSARLNEMRPQKLDVYHERPCEINRIVKQTWFFSKPQRELFAVGRSGVDA